MDRQRQEAKLQISLREITGSIPEKRSVAGMEHGCCLDEWPLSDPVLASSPPLVVVRKSPLSPSHEHRHRLSTQVSEPSPLPVLIVSHPCPLEPPDVNFSSTLPVVQQTEQKSQTNPQINYIMDCLGMSPERDLNIKDKGIPHPPHAPLPPPSPVFSSIMRCSSDCYPALVNCRRHGGKTAARRRNGTFTVSNNVECQTTLSATSESFTIRESKVSSYIRKKPINLPIVSCFNSGNSLRYYEAATAERRRLDVATATIMLNVKLHFLQSLRVLRSGNQNLRYYEAATAERRRLDVATATIMLNVKLHFLQSLRVL
ncbi:hypothetical protein J6590_026264 [Homalodisca vitripennis]|nr:hypothetical protein J6590_026264 [Homalodisca vitripennis]